MNKQEIIALAKELAETEDLTLKVREVATLKREAVKFINRDADSIAEAEENELLNKYYKIVLDKSGMITASLYDAKKELVEKAKALINTKDFKKAADEMNEIFNELKTIGNCGKEKDDELWAQFKDARNKFNEARNAHFAAIKEKIENAKNAKEELVNEANDVLAMENFKEATKKITELMDKWKEAGYAGKENDDALWAKFQEARKAFFAKRNEYYDALTKEYNEKAAKKEELIKKAKIALANSKFNEEEINQIKALRAAWKEIGFAGKNNEDALWPEFNEIINTYFKEMKAYHN